MMGENQQDHNFLLNHRQKGEPAFSGHKGEFGLQGIGGPRGLDGLPGRRGLLEICPKNYQFLSIFVLFKA
jgi:hypothetical protein